MIIININNVFNKRIKEFENIPLEDKEELFESFRTERKIYGYIDNGDNPPDENAVSISKNINEELYNKYVEHNKNKLILGYKNSTQEHASYTQLDSRHIMMSVLLFTWLPQKVENIVEIGGGFGNWVRLNMIQSFKKWTIIDLPHMIELQEWYLNKENISKQKYELISALNYDKWNSKKESYDLVIGTHSLSEFKFEVFKDYFKKVVMKADYFFFCYCIPFSECIDLKLRFIDENFMLLNSVLSEGNNVANNLYIRKID